jgi:hypothetical protein
MNLRGFLDIRTVRRLLVRACAITKHRFVMLALASNPDMVGKLQYRPSPTGWTISGHKLEL